MSDAAPVRETSSPTGDAAPRPLAVVNGKYTLERRLGGGGMAEVFLARTLGADGFSRPVAIKRVLDAHARDPRFVDMFISEAHLSARLQHPNVVSVLDFDRDADGRPFLVMELVDGVDLRGLMDAGPPLPFSVVIHLAIEILRGLDYAHDMPTNADGVRGLVHRDISPHNVLISWEGAVKVSDFGIAKARARTHATGSVLIKGKPAYMSPEQVQGRPLDGRSDLFAVGVMLFEMLCSEHLFAGSTVEETLGHVLYRDIPLARATRAEVPEDLSRVVAALLTRDRDQRLRSAEAAIAALITCVNCPRAGREELMEVLARRFAGRAPIRARNVSHASHSDPTIISQSRPGNAVAPMATGTIPGARPSGGRRWLWPVLAALLVISGMAAVLTLKPDGSKPAVNAVPASSPPSEPARAAPLEPQSSGRAASAPAFGGSSAGGADSVLPTAPATDREPATNGSSSPVAPRSGQQPTPPMPARERGRTPTRTQDPAPKPDRIQEIDLR